MKKTVFNDCYLAIGPELHWTKNFWSYLQYHDIPQNVTKIYEESEIFTVGSQSVNWPWFHGCSQKTWNLWVKNKGKFVTQSNSSSQRMILFALALQSSILQGDTKGSSDMWTHSWLQERNLEFREPDLLYWAVSISAHCSGKKILHLPRL